VLDYKPSQIDMVRRFGYKVFYGDASRLELLKSAGADEARLFVLAVDDQDKAIEIAGTVRKYFPDLKILARSFDRRHSYDLMKAGVDVIQRETFGSALNLGESALRALGFHGYQAHRAALTFKHYDEKHLNEIYESLESLDEKEFIQKTIEKNQDLIEILQSDQEDIEKEDDHAWERPSEL